MIFVVKKIPYHLGTCFFGTHLFMHPKKSQNLPPFTFTNQGNGAAMESSIAQLDCALGWVCCHMGVSKNSGTPKSSILIGFSIINHPYWGTPIFGNIHMQGFGPKTRLAIVTPGPWVKTATELPLKFRLTCRWHNMTIQVASVLFMEEPPSLKCFRFSRFCPGVLHLFTSALCHFCFGRNTSFFVQLTLWFCWCVCIPKIMLHWKKKHKKLRVAWQFVAANIPDDQKINECLFEQSRNREHRGFPYPFPYFKWFLWE